MDPYKRSEYSLYFIVGLASAFLLALSILIYKISPNVGTFTKELSFAGFIALIVIFTLEKFTKERHHRETFELIDKINVNLFEAIYKKHIPEEVFWEVKDLLLSQDVSRSNYSVDYRLEETNEKTYLFNVTVTTTSEYHNITPNPVLHHARLFLEKNILDNVSDPYISEVSIAGAQLESSVLANHCHLDDHRLEFAYPIEIPANSSVRVVAVGHLTKARVDSESWVTGNPTIGMKINVSGPAGMKIFGSSLHSKDLEIQKTSESSVSLEIRGGLLPGQGMKFWWNIA